MGVAGGLLAAEGAPTVLQQGEPPASGGPVGAQVPTVAYAGGDTGHAPGPLCPSPSGVVYTETASAGAGGDLHSPTFSLTHPGPARVYLAPTGCPLANWAHWLS